MSNYDGALTGDTLLTDSARIMLLCQKTQAMFCCGDARCLYSLVMWEADLPSWATESPRAWPKCPEGHKAKFLRIAEG